MKIKQICKNSILMAICLYAGAVRSENSIYQIDMIVWVNEPQNTPILSSLPILTNDTNNMVELKDKTGTNHSLYRQLPRSSSSLQRQYWTLRHKPNYNIVAYYSWLQSTNNQRTVKLPNTYAQGWELEGNVRVRASNYYLFNTELLFKKSNKANTAFIVKQSVRLKPNTTYYLDNPSAGILIKVHKYM